MQLDLEKLGSKYVMLKKKYLYFSHSEKTLFFFFKHNIFRTKVFLNQVASSQKKL